MVFQKIRLLASVLIFVTQSYSKQQRSFSQNHYVSESNSNLSPTSTFFSKSVSWTSKFDHNILDFRGGGFAEHSVSVFSRLLKIVQTANPVKLNKVQATYVASLEEQIEILERQIRTSREESRQLRSLINSKSSSSRKNSSDAIRKGVVTESHLRDELQSLQRLIQELETTKKELSVLLEMEKKQMEILTRKLEAEKQKVHATEDRAKVELEELRKTLLEQSKKQLEQLQKSAEKRLDAEQKRLETAALDAVVAEKKKGEEAVEKEKIKMRKLVKVLAEKERKEMKKANKKPKEERTAKIIQGNTGSGSLPGKKKSIQAMRGNSK
uniref:Uncharacterized protein n=1 Tax=Eucampia antarctica TaxID=49252 RepID=A0A7S2QZR4_9STRA|mmetsp:Transcript_10971/g.10487  ORF Transcript_10971/g.10487 Transcript_10971/m.10487 type:complete len:325 (+) Transcript_10971:33-1007(+)|eukprot:CAMPEP_0197826914 /NCGR_PEP_ID=MMETSP1437-20131217/3799_1 /TAXON_ID=49252 ORGANISM="Eucampia antarctica, Strain CCMP1452" /NCGR_SAMPLE_ID=MMETSP1437 /ASSEMBLY_ACC=CAM_ASM_001096 /LENGTH=324 /DNA_ID=CAMNT_0043427557 /DNA_START=33 /DNA_END=1007 /DNA_ORIENTATION=+